ncbi:dicarboxylate/amino acid:cation symporter [Sphingomonas yunnanensis]|uniref:dicarboxylate/amino acid:cation symporter n=1 Tax=Sphingomonas yunnanensis TaxID=310400 RepID=UPI001CA74853|nr:dicarboxylate/amino acid:cation symporter [Sphingomonas yunnanensis]MBY9064537.1 dicarboxylate/amino acid:cation symporter [Sphingomonas yunnanensis]
MKSPSFTVQVFAGMAIGVALGFAARDLPPLAEGLRLTGDSFVQLLKALVVPLVFTAIVASIAALRDLGNAARLVGQTLLWFGVTALIAVTIGLTLGTLLEPGVRSGVDPSAAVLPATTGSWLDFLRGLIPGNFLGIEASTKLADGGATTKLGFNVLQLIVIAIAVGAAAVNVGEAGGAFLAANASLLAIFRRLLRWVVRLTPIGTAGLIGTAIVRYGWSSLAALGSFAGTVYLGLALVLFLVYPALLALNRLSVTRFFATAWPAIQLGFVSRSSIATLPVTEQAAERAGVPRDYAAFAVPFAATTKMDGCAAVYPAVAALFVAQYYGIALHASDYVLVALVSVVGSAATAGLTGALVMLTLTLTTLGLPLEGAGLLLAVDPIIDMGRTAVNVAGQVLVPLIVAKRENMLEPDGTMAPLPRHDTVPA